MWFDQGRPHREYAADSVARFYYRQAHRLLHSALTNPLDRVMYTPLTPFKKDFDFVRDMMMVTGVLDRKIEFEEYTDTRFAEQSQHKTTWTYAPGDEKAQ